MFHFMLWFLAIVSVHGSDSVSKIINAVKENSKIKKTMDEMDVLLPGSYVQEKIKFTVCRTLISRSVRGVKGYAVQDNMLGVKMEKGFMDQNNGMRAAFVDPVTQEILSMNDLITQEKNIFVFQYNKVNPLSVFTNIQIAEEKAVNTTFSMSKNWDGDLSGHATELDTRFSALKTVSGAYADNNIGFLFDLSMGNANIKIDYELIGALEYGIKILGKVPLYSSDPYEKEFSIPIPALTYSISVLGLSLGVSTTIRFKIGIEDIAIFLAETLSYIKRTDFKFGVSMELSKNGIDFSKPIKSFSHSNNNNITNFISELINNIQLTATPFLTIGLGVEIGLGATSFDVHTYIKAGVPLEFGFNTKCPAPYLEGSFSLELTWITEWSNLTVFGYNLIDASTFDVPLYEYEGELSCLFSEDSTREGDPGNTMENLPKMYVVQPMNATKYDYIDNDPYYKAVAQFCTSSSCDTIQNSITYTTIDLTKNAVFLSKFIYEGDTNTHLRWYVTEIDIWLNDDLILDPIRFGDNVDIKRCKTNGYDSICISTKINSVDSVYVGKEFGIKSQYTSAMVAKDINKKYLFLKHGRDQGYSIDQNSNYFDDYIQTQYDETVGMYSTKQNIVVKFVSMNQIGYSLLDYKTRAYFYLCDINKNPIRYLDSISFTTGTGTVTSSNPQFQKISCKMQIPNPPQQWIKVVFLQSSKADKWNGGMSFIDPEKIITSNQIPFDVIYDNSQNSKLTLSFSNQEATMVVETNKKSPNERGIFVPLNVLNGLGSCSIDFSNDIQYGCTRFIINMNGVINTPYDRLCAIIKAPLIIPLCDYESLGDNTYCLILKYQSLFYYKDEKVYINIPFKRKEKIANRVTIQLIEIFNPCKINGKPAPINPPKAEYSSASTILYKNNGFLISKDYDPIMNTYMVFYYSGKLSIGYTTINSEYRLYKVGSNSIQGYHLIIKSYYSIDVQTIELVLSRERTEWFCYLDYPIYVSCSHCSSIKAVAPDGATMTLPYSNEYFSFIPTKFSEYKLIPYCNNQYKSFCRVKKQFDTCNNVVSFAKSASFTENNDHQGTSIARNMKMQVLWNRCNVEYTTMDDNYISSVQKLNYYQDYEIVITPFDETYYIVSGMSNGLIIPLSLNQIVKDCNNFLKTLNYKKTEFDYSDIVFYNNGSLLIKKNQFDLPKTKYYNTINYNIFDIPYYSMNTIAYKVQCPNGYVDSSNKCSSCHNGCYCDGQTEICPTQSVLPPTKTIIPPTKTIIPPTITIIPPTESESSFTESYTSPTESESSSTESYDTTQSESSSTESYTSPTESESSFTETYDTTESESSSTESYTSPTESESSFTESYDPTINTVVPPTMTKTPPSRSNLPRTQIILTQSDIPSNKDSSDPIQNNDSNSSNAIVFGGLGGSFLIILAMIIYSVSKMKKKSNSSSSTLSSDSISSSAVNI